MKDDLHRRAFRIEKIKATSSVAMSFRLFYDLYGLI